MRQLVAAVVFLTRLPVGRLLSHTSADVARGAAWFPLVGGLIGAISAAVAALTRNRLPPAVIAVLLVLVEALLTGALHFDGLADSADGLGGGKNREDVLRIMRDHAIGSYGATALAILIALKVSAYQAILQRPDWAGPIIVSPVLGRWSILLAASTLAYARDSASIAQGIGKPALFWGSLTAAAAAAATRTLPAWLAAVSVAAVTGMFGLFCRRRIGGFTGDTLGAGVEIAECAALLSFLWT